MRKSTLWAIVATGLTMLVLSVLTASVSFFVWAMAMNGFMGQERAANASMITFVLLVILAVLLCLALSLFSVYYFSVKRTWNAVVAAIVSVIVFAAVNGGLQLVSVLVSVLVAEQMRMTH